MALADIEERALSRLSPMPNNVADLVGEENIPHLLAFLLERRLSRAGN